MCDCINAVRDALHKAHPEALRLYFTHISTALDSGKKKFALPFDMEFEGKKRTKHSFLVANYCPICGRKYEEDKEPC